MAQEEYVCRTYFAEYIVDTSVQIKLTKDGSVLLKEMVLGPRTLRMFWQLTMNSKSKILPPS
jgi:hypothetical protein